MRFQISLVSQVLADKQVMHRLKSKSTPEIAAHGQYIFTRSIKEIRK